MDEATKQKVLIGVLVVVVGVVLAINFWPDAPAASVDEGFTPTARTHREPEPEGPQTFTVQQDEAPEEEVSEDRRRRPAEEEGGATIRRKTAPKAEKETIVPAA